MKKKILIIKLGFTETLESTVNDFICYGDILRTTVLLGMFSGNEISWLVDKSGMELLAGNGKINNLLLDSEEVRTSLMQAHFDVLINLEKGIEICQLADQISAVKKCGFGVNVDGTLCAYKGAEKVLSISQDNSLKQQNSLTYQELLGLICGKSWSGETYELAYSPKGDIQHDIGLNWQTGSRWHNKSWPLEHWQELELLLKEEYTVSWQEGLSNINEYIEWINSLNLLVTNDSLGLHIAIALKKKFIGIFGPTSSKEIYSYGYGVFLVPKQEFDCMPCFNTDCFTNKFCIASIKPEDIRTAVEKELS